MTDPLDGAICSLAGGYYQARDVLDAVLRAKAAGSDVAEFQIWRFDTEEALAAVLEAVANHAGVAVIRSLGFVGGSCYCADCMNHFHSDLGQHKPGCSVLASLTADLEDPA